MEPLIENIYAENRLEDLWADFKNIAGDSFEILNNGLRKTIEEIEQLDRRLLHLNTDLLEFNTQALLKVSYLMDNDPEILSVNSREDDGKYFLKKEEPRDIRDSDEFIGTLEGVRDLAGYTKNIVQYLEEASPNARKLNKMLDAIEGVAEGIPGMAELAPGARTGLSAARGMSMASEIMAGAAGVAEFGPPGWITGLSALFIGGVAASVLSDSPGSAYEIEGIADSSEMKKYFWDKEKQKDREKLIDLCHITNYKQLDEVEQELNRGYMVADRMKRVNQLLERTEVDFPDLRNKWVEPARQDVNEYLHSLLPFLPAPPTNAEKMAEEVKNAKGLALLNTMYGSLVDYAKLDQDIDKIVRKYKPVYLPQDTVYRLPTAKENDVRARERRRLAMLPETEPSPGKQKKPGWKQHSLSVVSGSSGRIININLNKAMIENFTINTKDIKEGLSDFKHKVEEVLLEILNSANVIQ